MKHFRFPLITLLILLVTVLACGNTPDEEPASARVYPSIQPTITSTSLPPTDTAVPPTDTPVPPTDTPLPTETPLPPTDTPIPPTETPVPPTATPQPTQTPRPPTRTPLPPTATPIQILLRDNFDGGLGDGWQPFLNYWRLEWNQWYWSTDGGVNGSGAMAHTCCAVGEADDALMMYLGDGAEGWTDYHVEVDVLVPTEKKGQWQGLWLRGQYEERGRRDTAQWVTGYFVMLGRQRSVKLLQLQTAEDCDGESCSTPKWLYAFNNPYTLRGEQVEALQLTRGAWHTLAVEVQGNRIKIWVDGVFAFEHVDDKSPFLQGTVGFITYRSEPVHFDNMVVTPLN